MFFLALRAAFNSVDRRVLMKAMRRREVREGLVLRCENILRETEIRCGWEGVGAGILDRKGSET